ncbi:hypothetical protein, partial [Stenotrophomonas sp.]|uniref:hypothetical protein n=1 Tax=Stenotrophomonas sp. TaxID=69392 RepID=UPI0028A77CEB
MALLLTRNDGYSGTKDPIIHLNTGKRELSQKPFSSRASLDFAACQLVQTSLAQLQNAVQLAR